MKTAVLAIVGALALIAAVTAYGAAPAPVVTIDNVTATTATVHVPKCGTYRYRIAQRQSNGTYSANTTVFVNHPCAPPPNPACSDGLDNDNDGFIDYPADKGCTSTTDTDEADPVTGGEPGPIAGQGYHQVFRDDFNGTALDSTVWNPKEFWEDVPTDPNAVVVSNGTVKINNNRSCCDDQSIQTGPYWGGEPIKRSWQYGYFEARMKFTDAQGSWPAFWLQSVSHSQWNEQCPQPDLNFELDIMEYQGDEPNTFYGSEHRNTNSYCGIGDSTRPNVYPQPGKLAGDWHTFAITWTSSTIIWYVDGVQMSSATTFDSGNQPMFITLTMQACGWDSSNSCTSSTPNPLTTEVDYVQVWQK